jgi:hypothetical protein
VSCPEFAFSRSIKLTRNSEGFLSRWRYAFGATIGIREPRVICPLSIIIIRSNDANIVQVESGMRNTTNHPSRFSLV